MNYQIKLYFQEFLQGATLMEKKKYAEAIEHFQNSLNSYDESKEKEHNCSCYQNIAECYRMLEDYEEAAMNYMDALDMNPKLEYEYLKLAECCLNINTGNSVNTATEYLNQCLNHFPNNTEALINLGIANILLGRNSEAKEALLKAERLGNKDARKYITENL